VNDRRFAGISPQQLGRELTDGVMHVRGFLFHEILNHDPRESWEELSERLDRTAQELYLTRFRRHLPGFGIIAEENEAVIPCTLEGLNLRITVDPFDGSKSLGKRNAHVTGTQVALLEDDTVAAAYVAETMGGTIIGFGPDGIVRWISPKWEMDFPQDLSFQLQERGVCLSVVPDEHSEVVSRISAPQAEGGLFLGLEVVGGGIAVRMHRLWNGEFAALVLNPEYDTPWDRNPTVAVSQKLGFVFLRPTASGAKLELFTPEVITEKVPVGHDIVVIHERFLPELEALGLLA
jgi:fructose-1,6-bisphosphatase/inositol monophosphatase family enzyme